MIKVTLVSPSDCPNCVELREQLSSLQKTYPDLTIETVDASSPEGEKLILKHGILSSPGILLNNRFWAMGAVSKQKLIQAIKEAEERHDG